MNNAKNFTTTSFQLENGLKVIVQPKPGAPVASMQIWYKVGSFHEEPGTRGIAHLFEHMMFRGSKSFGPEEHTHRIKQVGGSVNAYTTEDMTVYHQTIPSDHIELTFELEADRMGNLLISQELLTTELEVVKEEFREHLNSPFSQAHFAFRELFFNEHPYALTPLGLMDDLDKMTLESCEKFYKRYYTPGNSFICVAGNVDSEHIKEISQKYFGNIPPANGNGNIEIPAVVRSETDASKKLDMELSIVSIAYDTPETSHEDIPSLEIISSILSDGESSRLGRKLVNETHMAITAGGMPLFRKYAGAFVVLAATLPGQSLSRAENQLRKEIDRIRTEPVSKYELEKTLNQALSEKIFGRYSADQLASNLAESELFYGDYRNYEKMIDRYRNITPEDLFRVANQYLSDDKEVIMRIHPKKVNPLYFIAGMFQSFKGIFK